MGVSSSFDIDRADLCELLRTAREHDADHTAIEFGAQHFSMEFFRSLVDAGAESLTTAGVKPGHMVSIWVEDPFDALLAILSVIDVGAVFAPVAPQVPTPRFLDMLATVSPDAVIVDTHRAKPVAGHFEREPAADGNAWLSRGLSLIPIGSNSTRAEQHIIDGLCYVYFTSGSTGTPKAVAGRRQGLLHFLSWEINTLGITKDWRVAQLTNVGIDAHLRDTLLPLLVGGTVAIPEQTDLILHPSHLGRWLREQAIHILHTVPSVVRLLAATHTDEKVPSLLFALLVGERLFPADVSKALKVFGNQVQLINLYGSTESNLCKFAYHLHPQDSHREFIPVGGPMPDVVGEVLDDELRPCSEGEVGEICMRSPYLSLGYYGRPDLTDVVFVPNPNSPDLADRIYRTGDFGRQLPDGAIQYLGRRDNQLKIAGLRVDLGDIECALEGHPDVAEAAVVAINDGGESTSPRLIAYVSTHIEASALREYLVERLPTAMIPAHLEILEELPHTTSGKVDRKALPEPVLARTPDSQSLPRNDVEARLVDIWQEILGRDDIGTHDNFFSLGGNSIQLAQMVTRIEEAFAFELEMTSLLRTPTISTLAIRFETEFLATKTVTETQWPIHLREGDGPALFICSAAGGVFYDYNLVGALKPGRPIYALTVRNFYSSLSDLAADNIAAMRAIQSKGPYFILGQSFGGRTALEMGRQLEKQGEVAHIVMLDTMVPRPWLRAVGTSLVWILETAAAAMPGFMRLVVRKLLPSMDLTSRRLLIALPPHCRNVRRLQRVGEFTLGETVAVAPSDTFESLWDRIYRAALPNITEPERRFLFAAARLENAEPNKILHVIQMYKHNSFCIRRISVRGIVNQPVTYIGSTHDGNGWRQWCKNARILKFEFDSEGAFGPHLTMHTSEGVKKWVHIVEEVLEKA